MFLLINLIYCFNFLFIFNKNVSYMVLYVYCIFNVRNGRLYLIGLFYVCFRGSYVSM